MPNEFRDIIVGEDVVLNKSEDGIEFERLSWIDENDSDIFLEVKCLNIVNILSFFNI